MSCKDLYISIYHSQMNLLRIYLSKTVLTTLRVANQRKMGIDEILLINWRRNKEELIIIDMDLLRNNWSRFRSTYFPRVGDCLFPIYPF